jgi:hypothetical protein
LALCVAIGSRMTRGTLPSLESREHCSQR